MALSIYFDGDCPFCNQYVQLLRLRETDNNVRLINLREDPAEKQRLEAAGYNLDEGMVVDIDGKVRHGSDALNTLALLSTPSSSFNRFNKWAFSSSLAAKLAYPVLRSGRWLTLFVMGRHGLTRDPEGTVDRSAIFAVFFSLFSVFHFFNYALEYGRFPPSADMYAIFVCAIALFFQPKSARLLALLMLVSTVSAVLQAPIASNHTIVRNAMLLGYWASFAYAWAGGRSWSAIFGNFALSGQGILLVMYFYGIFHKINTGFLDPETSCAVFLWRLMPPPMVWLDFPAVHYLAIYGTFVVEGALILALLTRRYRHYGIVAGIAFHMFLALSSYAMYISFTTLSIALHSLFLSPDAARRIFSSPEMQFVRNRIRHPLYVLTALVLAVSMFMTAVFGHYTYTTLSALPIIVPFCYLVIRYGQPDIGADTVQLPKAPWIIASVVTMLFFLNGLMPYLGLKSAQSINMFANLRLEAGASNHLVFSAPHRPFRYLDEVAIITDSGGNGRLEHFKEDGWGMVYYDLLALLDANPDLTVSYTLGQTAYTDISAREVRDDISKVLHPNWVRKWFHFQPVNLDDREACNV